MVYLHGLEPLAPLHQPHNLAAVEAFMRACPGLPQVACFDTAFHAGTPEVEQRFALPDRFLQQGVRRYGFHGLSYRYLADRLAALTPRAAGRMLLAHLGNGASLCAVRAGRSLATTMGFSALDGLMMGTRSGALDPGVLLHLLRQGWSGPEIEKLLYKQSGLLGVSGLSADMRSLRASSEPAAARAIELFTYRVVRESGALAACLGGLDLIAFTGGIGEHDAALRAEVCAALGFLGVELDAAANRAADGRATAAVHAAGSAVELWVVPTDEGRVAAADALALLEAS
jgi:acetate kinase